MTKIMKLVIGNKTYSSWSMRPWVLMKHLALPFEEILIRFATPETRMQMLSYSPTGKVPVLVDGDLHVWDSLAIMEYLNEKFPEKQILPIGMHDRAYARSLCSEMHSGFVQMRERLSFHAKKTFTNFDVGPAQADLIRIQEIWNRCLKSVKTTNAGPFLFGEFTMVDAMYAPVVCRLQTYGVTLEGQAGNYQKMMMNLPAVQSWYAGANAEDFIAADHE